MKGQGGSLLFAWLGLAGSRGIGRIPRLFINIGGHFDLNMCILRLSLGLAIILTELSQNSKVLMRNLSIPTSSHSIFLETPHW